jgi:hypothetical protein
MWPVATGEMESLARTHGLAMLKVAAGRDLQDRPEVRWTSYVLQLPDDGAGALPLLRGIILNDDKSATYKLGLIRAIARIADTAPALAIDRADSDVVDLPLGAVALNWLRMYLPLAAADLTQRPGNRGAEKLGFAGEGFRRLLADHVAGQDLRIGARFTGERAIALAQALADARTNIVRMPVHFTRFPKAQEIEVKRVARELLEKLRLLVSGVDWLRGRQSRAAVLSEMRFKLNELPEDPYPEPLWNAKVEQVWDFVLQRYAA